MFVKAQLHLGAELPVAIPVYVGLYIVLEALDMEFARSHRESVRSVILGGTFVEFKNFLSSLKQRERGSRAAWSR